MCQECSSNLDTTLSQLARPVLLANTGDSPYEPLDPVSREIRLIEIIQDHSRYFDRPADNEDNVCLRLHTVSLDEQPEYDCISYCWGSSETRMKINVDGRHLWVSTQINSALMSFHDLAYNDLQSLRLWADAVCINQNDTEEREQQITFMHHIYAQAQQVRVYIGWYVDRTVLEMNDTLLAFHEVTSGDFELDESDDANTLSTYYRLVPIIRDRYWERRWTTQELAYATSLSLYLGPWHVEVTKSSFERLCDFCEILRTRLSVIRARSDDTWYELHLRHPYAEERTQTVFSILDEATRVESVMNEILMAMRLITPGQSIGQLVFAFLGGHNCAVRHDHVYALMNLLPREVAIRPDYSLPWELAFADFTFKIMMLFKSVYLLRYAGTGSTTASWAIDWGSKYISAWTSQFPEASKAVPDDSRPSFNLGKEAGSMIVSAMMIDQVKLVTIGMEDDLIGSKKRHAFEALDRWSAIYREIFEPDRTTETASHPVVLKVVLRGEVVFPFLEFLDPEDFGMTITEENLPAVHRRIEKCRHDNSVLPRCISSVLSEGVFVITEGGRPGHTVHGTQPEDKICLIAGSAVPFCIRPRPDKGEHAYNFVGPCYLEGAMNGEAYEQAVAALKETLPDVQDDDIFHEVTLI